jgi:hypothetical protein
MSPFIKYFIATFFLQFAMLIVFPISVVIANVGIADIGMISPERIISAAMLFWLFVFGLLGFNSIGSATALALTVMFVISAIAGNAATVFASSTNNEA